MLLWSLCLGSVFLSSFCCDAYKILLVFPISTRSHSILGEGYVKYLSEAGHEITYITPYPIKNPPPRVHQIDVSANIVYLPVEVIFDTRPLMNQDVDYQNVNMMLEGGLVFANGTLHIDEVQNLLDDPKEEFDAVIVEWLYTDMFSGLSAVFNCPLIWSSSMDPHSLLLALVDEHLNPAYTTHHLSRHYGTQFWDRVHQLWILYNARFSKWLIRNDENQVYTNVYEKFVTKRGRQLPSYDEVRYNASLILGNSYISSGDAISLPQSYKAIGGYHIPKEIDPLPQDLQKIMDSAKHGVIYFSMGSLLKSSRMPDQLKKDLLKVFASLKQTVIWKFEETLDDLPKNVHILPWVPQTSVLAHPNCVLFISHGGLLSKLEALHFGVPIIGIPLYGDQFLNINRAEAKGFGKRVDLHQAGAGKLNEAIREVLENPRYRERIKEYSFIYHDRPVPPEKELVHWVEHVIKTRGAPHMRSLALHVPWYQKYYLDLAAVIILVIVILVKLFKQARMFIRTYLKEKYA